MVLMSLILLWPKKSSKNIVNIRFDKKLNRSEAEISQSTYQRNTNTSRSILSTI